MPLFRIACLKITLGSQRVIQRPMCWVPLESWLPDEYFEHLQTSESLRKVPELTGWKLHQKRSIYRIACLKITLGSQRVIQRPMCWVPLESWLPDEYFEHLQISESFRKVPEMTVWKLHQIRALLPHFFGPPIKNPEYGLEGARLAAGPLSLTMSGYEEKT